MTRALSPRRWYVQLLSAWCVAWIGLPLHLPLVYGNPSGSTVQTGSVNISGQGGQVTVKQTSDRAVIHWNDFSIRQGETTTFVQPNSRSATLNRVTGSSVSRLDGSLNANGRVYLVNKNGVVVGKTGRINTASFTASTSDVSNAEFMKGGDLNFSGNSTAKVINYGKIKATDGDVTLIARQVENHGKITAKNGRVQLAAGTEVLIKSDGAERVFISPGAKGAPGETGVINTGKVRAAVAELKAAGGNEYALAINNSGVIRANGSRTEGGRVYLSSTGGRVVNSGQVRAVNPDGSGGEIRVAAAKVELKRGSSLDASASRSKGGKGGTVLVGGDWQGKGTMEQAKSVTVEAGAQVKADATSSSGSSADGGKVVIWSTGLTDFNGFISAQGIYGGAGGNVETSGHDLNIGLAATVVTNGGNWLLDPVDLEVVTSGGTGSMVADTVPPATINDPTSSTINASVIVAALNNGTVTLLASNSITINEAINSTGNTGTFGLVLNAPTLFLNQAITLKAGATLSGTASTVNISSTGKIQNGLDAVASGGLVSIGVGTYSENITIRKSLELRGAGNSLTIVDGKNNLISTATVVASSGIININNIRLTRSVLTDGTVAGGGINIATGNTVTISNAMIDGNRTTAQGGGVYNAGTVTIIDSTIQSNKGGNGGGISNAGFLTLSGSLIYDNTGVGGGGLFNTATSTIYNSTIAYNKANSGAGISTGTGSTLNLDSVTIARNTTNGGSNVAGGLANSGTVNIRNSIIALNAAGSSGNSNSVRGSSVNDLGNNFVDWLNGGNLGFTTSTLISTGPNDPKLSALGNFGGPTFTMMPLAASPLIGAGSSAYSVDQRGLSRTAGSMDIGAFQTRDLGTYVVTNTLDFTGIGASGFNPALIAGSLRYGLMSGDRYTDINFNLSAGDAGYNSGTGRWIITNATGNTAGFQTRRSININGNSQLGWSAANPVIELNGGAIGSVMSTNHPAANTVNLNGLYITNGLASAGGGILATTGTTNIYNSTITGNTATGAGAGGGINVAAVATINVYTSRIDNNFATNSGAGGGGIYLIGGVLTISDSFVRNNKITGATSNGGGIFTNGGTLTITNTTFSGNEAFARGGAIYTTGATTTIIRDSNFTLNNATSTTSDGGAFGTISSLNTTIERTTFDNNSATRNGGALYLSVSGGIIPLVTIDRGTFTNNDTTSTSGQGGAVYDTLVPLAISNSTFSGNVAVTNGGAVFSNSPSFTVTNSTFLNNSTFNSGGGIYSGNPTLTITGSTFDGNVAMKDLNSIQDNGGGVYYSSTGGTLTIDSSLFYRNRSETGGGLSVTQGTQYVLNSTFTENTATAHASSAGGAIRITTGSVMTIRNSTITGNLADVSGGGIVRQTGGTLALENTIVANNSTTPNTLASGIDILSGNFTDNGNNLIGVREGIAGTINSDPGAFPDTYTQVGTFAARLDPMLSPLANHGGPTWTMGLLPGSPALARGKTLAVAGVDQRGVARPIGKSDIGAFESQGFAYVAASGSGQSAQLMQAFGAPLVVTVISNDGIANLSGGKISITVPGSGASATGTLLQTLNASNQASYSLTANATLGTYDVGIAGGPSSLWSLTNAPINLSILPSSGQSKTYGDADPTPFGYTISMGSLLTGDVLTGDLAYSGGSGAGLHAFLLGTLGNPKYNLTLDGAVMFTINQRSVVVTPNSGQSKIYGNADPAFTYSTTAMVGADSLSGNISYVGGPNVGTYAFTLGNLGNPNYSISLSGAPVYFAINQRTITITPNAGQGKKYGFGDPALTSSQTGTLQFSDAITGALTYAGGPNVGAYDITQGTLALNPNYNLVFTTGVKFNISARDILVTPNSGQGKKYGFADPTLTYTIGGDGMAPSETPSGALAYVGGPDVGAYDITQGGLTVSSNYNLTFTSGIKFNISKRDITVTPHTGITKMYGEMDPALTYDITGDGLAGAETLTGALNYTGGPDVGNHPIVQNTLAASGNYNLTFTSGRTFGITPRSLIITPNSGQQKMYGDADPASYTFAIGGNGIATGDTAAGVFSGGLTRDAGEAAGTYQIRQGSLSTNGNYTFTLASTPVNFLINGMPITITPNFGQGKVYGNLDPASLTYSITSGSLVPGDSLTGELQRVAGENAGIYAITQGTLSAPPSYLVTFNPVMFTIEQRPVTVTPLLGQGRIYGFADGTFSYSVGGDGLVGSDKLTGALGRAGGLDVGTYAYTQGTLAAGSNYIVSFLPGSARYSITPRALTVSANPGQEKYVGEVDPAFRYSITSGQLAYSDALSGSLTRTPGESAGAYTLLQGTLGSTPNYSLSFSNIPVFFQIVPVSNGGGSNNGGGNEGPSGGNSNSGSGMMDLSIFNATRGRNNESEQFYTKDKKDDKHHTTPSYSPNGSTSQDPSHMSSYDVFGTEGDGNGR
ncbi:MAG TPA: MBG domain-containing protein [Candidatus Methylacidiphilales bacterium]|nr:MBG domain-containing protein [Candidatus Methylacidiphilales bacterium]